MDETDDVCKESLPRVGTREDGCCWLVLEGGCKPGDGSDKGALVCGGDGKRDILVCLPGEGGVDCEWEIRGSEGVEQY